MICWEGRDGEETELKASNLPHRDPPITAACQRTPELPKHVGQLCACRQPRPALTSGNHAGTARAAMATSHSVAITEPQLPREGSALLSITGVALTLPPLPKPSPSAIPAPTRPLWFVTGKFCSLAPGLEIMQIHFSPRCKEVTPGLCNTLVLHSTNTGLSDMPRVRNQVTKTPATRAEHGKSQINY